MGRPAFEPTKDQRDRVAALAQARVPLAEIVRQIGVTKKTLVKHFAAELGREEIGEKTSKRGKTLPPYEPSPEDRQAVEILAASKSMTRDEIADRLGITVEMLEYHFDDELKRGPARQIAETLIATKKAADAGNVSAQRLWYTLTGGMTSKAAAAPRTLPQGKKEQQSAAAQKAMAGGSRFMPLSPPARLVVNNGP